MTTFLAGPSLFLCAFLVHWILWRAWRPYPATRALLGIFLGTMVVGLVLLIWPLGWVRDGWEALQALLFDGASSLSYIIVYAGIEETSPTLVVVRSLHRAGSRGCTGAELEHALEEANLFAPKLEALKREGLVVENGELFQLSARGLALSRVVDFLATRVLRIPDGG